MPYEVHPDKIVMRAGRYDLPSSRAELEKRITELEAQVRRLQDIIRKLDRATLTRRK